MLCSMITSECNSQLELSFVFSILVESRLHCGISKSNQHSSRKIGEENDYKGGMAHSGSSTIWETLWWTESSSMRVRILF